MKKPADADIRNLFRRFGGDAESYQEIQQEYIDDKAGQSWPIVKAMEKARASAPTLRASVVRPDASAQSAPVLRQGLAVAQHSAPVAAHHAPVSAPDHQAAGKQTGSLSALFSRPEPAPSASVAPVRSLFAALSSPVKSEAINLREKIGPVPVSNQPVQIHRSENDPLNSVFSRLAGQPDNTSLPENNLRSMFGFLKKQ